MENYVKKKKAPFKEVLGLQKKLSKICRIPVYLFTHSPHTTLPPVLPIIIMHYCGSFVITDESILMHFN